jgi:hypothetical protein
VFESLVTMLVAAGLSASSPATVAELGWMSGRWQTETAGAWTEEAWLPPRAGMMLGLSRTGRGDRTGEFEFLRVEAGEDGVPVYWASPGGGAPVGFRLVESDAHSAVFENRTHDYPQRIAYRRDGASLIATISAADGGNAMSWFYRSSE